VITAFWDPEAEVWVAESEDITGLATEAGTLESLHRKLGDLVPELLQLNRISREAPPVFEVVTTHPIKYVS